MWEARVGMRCVCINDTWVGGFRVDGASFPCRVPMVNEVLTIASATVESTGLFLSFEEIPLRQGNEIASAEFTYNAIYFRPLRERKTDISLFRAILNGHRVPEEVE